MPLLACLWANRDHVFRLTSLGTMNPETCDYLRNVLGGLIRKTIFTLPFSREVNLSDAKTGSAIMFLLETSRAKRGILIMTPEQRLSFDVKWVEDVVKATGTELTQMFQLSSIKFCDLLDESDEILRPAHQLVYVMG